MKKIQKYSLLLLATMLLFACQQQNEVVVYSTVDQVFSEPILQDFEKETGIHVKAVFDTEETKSTGVLNRLIAEKNHPQCDVFWSGDPMRTIILKNKGLTTVYKAKNASGISNVFKDKDFHWIGFSARARVLIYNKKLLTLDSCPKSILDFTQPKYKGNIAIANPLFGTTTFHFAALFNQLGKNKAVAFLQDLKNNNVVIATSNGDVKKRVMQGKIACGLTDTDDAFEAMAENKNIGIVFLDQQDIGSLIMPNTVNLIRQSPNSENGKKLIDYLLSKKTEAKLAKSCAQMPLHKGVTVPKSMPSLDHIKAMQVDYEKTAKEMTAIQPILQKWIEE